MSRKEDEKPNAAQMFGELRLGATCGIGLPGAVLQTEKESGGREGQAAASRGDSFKVSRGSGAGPSSRGSRSEGPRGRRAGVSGPGKRSPEARAEPRWGAAWLHPGTPTLSLPPSGRATDPISALCPFKPPPFSPSFSGLSLRRAGAVSAAPASALPPEATRHDETLLAGDKQRHVGHYGAQEF